VLSESLRVRWLSGYAYMVRGGRRRNASYLLLLNFDALECEMWARRLVLVLV
jgi:hypothetical protein